MSEGVYLLTVFLLIFFLFLLSFQRVMAPSSLLMVLLAVAIVPGTWSDSEENELDYGYWNYREGGKSQKSVPSVASKSSGACKEKNNGQEVMQEK